MWDEGGLELCEYTIPQIIVIMFLRSIRKTPITYESVSPLRNRILLPEIQLIYVQGIIFARDMANIGI